MHRVVQLLTYVLMWVTITTRSVCPFAVCLSVFLHTHLILLHVTFSYF